MGNIFFRIMDYLGVKYTRHYSSEQYKAQPFGNSMYGLSMLLKRYHIENQCLKLSDKTQLKNVALPAVVIINGIYFICTVATDSKVTLLNAHGKNIEIPAKDFYKSWSGVLLTIRKTKDSIEPDYLKHLKKQKLADVKGVLLATCTALLIAGGLSWNYLRMEWWWYVVVLIDIAGTGVAYLLLQKELHIENGFTDRLCGLIKESHCEDVTESDGASFFGLAKMSEIGAGFFAVNLIALLFFPAALFEVAVIAAIVLPFTFWSVWYQKFRARSWCVLCLSTLALMWLQAGAFLAGGVYRNYSGQLNIPAGIVLLAAYGVAVLLTGRAIELIKQMKERDMWRQQFNTLKADEKVVEAFEKDAPEYGVTDRECSCLIFGNPAAERRITVFSNPYCGPCAMMHERIKDLPGEDCAVQYVMTYFSEEMSDINKYIIAAYQQLGATRTWEIMTEWYNGGKNLKAGFFKDLGLDTETEAVKAEFEKHHKWRDGKPLTGTPTVMVNGREMVMPYDVEDYMYMPLKPETA